ncbi:MAG: hypothetical protein CW716_07630 [Candidatus Bathyarchaeum sp.]|nr:MAG: hypothetical protein CW716_07630 [Candidatus Bathyarchaeum sp.]
MRAKYFKGIIAVAIVMMLCFCIVPQSYAQDTHLTYQLVNYADGTFSHNLNVVVPVSLNDYYHSLSHRSSSDTDFPKFVTPHVLQPVADCLRQIYPDDEDFANGVLTLVHQIPYEETLQAYYAVEVMLRNKGDCDLLSIIAASVMIAGGLDVVLLHYMSEQHMNIGVHLEEVPQDARSRVYSLTNKDVTYYVAECTCPNWQQGWRVGECPNDLKDISVRILPLTETEQVAPGQVSASFEKLEPTTIDLKINPPFTTEGNSITAQGQLSPNISNQEVTLYCCFNGGSWEILSTVVSEKNGSFAYTWNSKTSGLLDIRASWNGNDQYAGTTSQTGNTIIIPFYLIAITATAITAVSICIIVFLRTRHKKPTTDSPPILPSPESPESQQP